MIRACPTGETYAAQQDNHLPNFTTTSRMTHPFGVLSLKLPDSICLTQKSNFPSDRETAASSGRPPSPVTPSAPSLGLTGGPESPPGGAGSAVLPTWMPAGREAPARPAAPGTEGRPPRPRGAGREQSKSGEQGKSRGSPGKGRGLETTQKHRIEEEGAI